MLKIVNSSDQCLSFYSKAKCSCGFSGNVCFNPVSMYISIHTNKICENFISKGGHIFFKDIAENLEQIICPLRKNNSDPQSKMRRVTALVLNLFT